MLGSLSHLLELYFSIGEENGRGGMQVAVLVLGWVLQCARGAARCLLQGRGGLQHSPVQEMLQQCTASV